VAFVGAGFAAAVKMPLWKDLIEKLYQHVQSSGTRPDLLEYARECIEAREWARAASGLRQAGTTNSIQIRLRQLFSRKTYFDGLPDGHPAKLQMQARLEALIALPWAGIVTTNYDTLISDYVSATDRPWSNVSLKPSDNIGQALKSSDRPFFIHLHGNVKTGEMILTEEDYDDIYLGSSMIQSFLRALLLRYTVVFIGTQVEDRFVQFKRELQLLFKDRTLSSQGPPLSPEYVFLAETDKHRGTYLESTGGFKILTYPNENGRHEGLVTLLRQIRFDLAASEGPNTLDPVNQRLVEIIKEKGSMASADVLKAFWTGGPRPGYPDLNSRELTYRLYFLAYNKTLAYDAQYDTFRVNK
jgi:SIR2-like domain